MPNRPPPSPPPSLELLTFDLSDDAHGHVTIEATAAWPAASDAVRRPAAEHALQHLLDWARRAFPRGPGPLDDGHDWDHDLQHHAGQDGWHGVSLTISGTPAVAEAFEARFGALLRDDDPA